MITDILIYRYIDLLIYRFIDYLLVNIRKLVNPYIRKSGDAGN